jgi:hypothetical protein
MNAEKSPATHGLSRRNVMRAGAIGLGAAVVGAASPLLAAGSASALTLQSSWAYCEYCAILWYYSSSPTAANCCPSYTNSHTHSAVTSYNYEIPYPVTSGSNPQPGWAWCWQCGALFYATFQSKSVCPENDGGNHQSDKSYSYGLNYYSSFSGNNPQPGWYWCNACQGLWVVATGATNYCPKNGLNGHVIDDGTFPYGLTWSGEFHPTVSGP